MDSRDQFEATRRNFGRYEQAVSVGEYPAGMLQSQWSRTANNVARSTWSGNIMWTFAFGEEETSKMSGSVFSSGRQAWHLLNQMNDLCENRSVATLRSSALLIQLASELRAIAVECPERRFALELRVTNGTDGLPDLELMDNGVWRKPSLRMSTKSQSGTMMLGMDN